MWCERRRRRNNPRHKVRRLQTLQPEIFCGDKIAECT